MTLILDFLIPPVLVGIAMFALVRRFGWNLSSRMLLLVLFLAFGFLSSYFIPALIVLNATITVHNAEVAQTLDLPPDLPLLELFIPGWFEMIIWLIQAWIAIWVATSLAKTPKNKAADRPIQ